MTPSKAGYIAGTVGLASLPLDPPPARPPTLQELKLRWIDRLEQRRQGKTRQWASALKQCWIAAVGWIASGSVCATPPATQLQFKMMIQRTGCCFDEYEMMRLYQAWATADGKLSFDLVLADLQRAQQPDVPIFAVHAKHGSLDTKPIVPGSKSKSNLESHESSLALANLRCVHTSRDVVHTSPEAARAHCRLSNAIC